MTNNFRTLYNSVLKEMNQPPQQPAAQQPAAPAAAPVDAKTLAANITKIQDPELLAAIQQLLAAKTAKPAAAAPAQPQAQAPAPNAAQQPKTA